ncbi:MAG: hypothetical protein IKO75_07035 [Bacteroidales bacterium]|nr:hypothetical protein [Bacteroidales bacterium]
MPNLSRLDKNALSNIIRGFANKIFQSEAQFQFDLAWELQQQSWGNAKLEDMRMMVNKSNGMIGKCYTDIVLEQEDYSVAIELKYKTAEYHPKGGSYPILFGHDAVDEGRYDYLWDVHRIELLTGKGNKTEMNGVVKVLKGCNKGFAVLLTNEKQYWDKKYIIPGKASQSIDNQFRIGCIKGKCGNLFGKDLDWKRDAVKYPNNYNNYPATVLTKTNKPKFRAQPIHLDQAYKYKWEDYHNTQQPNGDFKFVIIEV